MKRPNRTWIGLESSVTCARWPNIASLRDFERFLRSCALRSANLLNRVDLARDVGVAITGCPLLEASGQIARLEPWFSSRTKSVVKRSQTVLGGCWTPMCASEHSLRGGPPSNTERTGNMGNVVDVVDVGKRLELLKQVGHTYRRPRRSEPRSRSQGG